VDEESSQDGGKAASGSSSMRRKRRRRRTDNAFLQPEPLSLHRRRGGVVEIFVALVSQNERLQFLRLALASSSASAGGGWGGRLSPPAMSVMVMTAVATNESRPRSFAVILAQELPQKIAFPLSHPLSLCVWPWQWLRIAHSRTPSLSAAKRDASSTAADIERPIFRGGDERERKKSPPRCLRTARERRE